MTTNTMHICADQIRAAISVPFIHIATPTAEALLADGIGKVGAAGHALYDGEALLHR